MNNEQINIGDQSDFQALFEELKKHVSEAQAHEIVEKIASAWYGTDEIDYMTIKACSEILELFRGQAQSLLGELRRVDGSPSETVIDLEERRLETEFRHVYRLYWVAMKLFYPMYDRAISGFSSKCAYPPIQSSTQIRIAA